MSAAEPEPAPGPVADDGLFPSGPWRGFYNYPRDPGRHRMDLDLEFRGGRLQGRGTDDVGFFLIAGTYDRESLEVTWRKTYPGSHHVSYRGFREGKGIWGTWNIAVLFHGGFHIWPKAAGDSDAAHEEASIVRPAARSSPAPLRRV